MSRHGFFGAFAPRTHKAARLTCGHVEGRHSPESDTGCFRSSGPWGFKSDPGCGTVTTILNCAGLETSAAHRPTVAIPPIPRKPVTGSERRVSRPSPTKARYRVGTSDSVYGPDGEEDADLELLSIVLRAALPKDGRPPPGEWPDRLRWRAGSWGAPAGRLVLRPGGSLRWWARAGLVAAGW